MQASYVLLLPLHMLFAVLSPLLFSARAWRSLRGLDPALGWLRYTPHAVDTLLLGSGIALSSIIHQYPFVDSWLTAKVLALVAYIGAGHVAVRRAHGVRGKLLAWLTAIALVLYIFAVAVNHDAAAGLR
jgi:uncharacterized membrane protein SirB2